MPLQNLFKAVPKDLREWTAFFENAQVVPEEESTDTPQLVDDSVTNDKLRNSAGLSVIGRATGSTGDPADIVGANNEFLRVRGSALGFGGLVDADIPASIARDTEVTSAVSSHEAASDPHPAYLKQAEADALYQPLAAVLSMLHTGTGSPEGVLVATVGHVYLRSDGGANTTLYVKESGSGNTGWVAK